MNIEQLQTNAETMRHILTLRALLLQCIGEFVVRANTHDLSKLTDPEVDLFTVYTPKLKDVEYGSEQYKQFLQELKPALDNHYANNSHHPEYFENGINGMNLFDVLEMMCDWKASGLRGKNGSLEKSLEIQKDRFGIDDQLFNIMKNTVSVINKMGEESNIAVSYPQYE
jgi:hypothetical protein